MPNLIGSAVRRTALAFIAGFLLTTSAVAQSSGIDQRMFNPVTAPLSLTRVGPEAQLISVATTDGLTLQGITIAPKDKPILLILHGAGASADDVGAWLAPLAERGYGLMLAEYRGFAANPGNPTRNGVLRDAQAFLSAARNRYPGKPIVVVGHSLGGGVAFDLALASKLDALVTIGTFAAVRDFLPAVARILVNGQYDNVEGLRRLNPELPYFLLHGTADKVIPSGIANRLHNLAVEQKRAGGTFVLTDQGHRPEVATIGAALDHVLAGGAHPDPKTMTLAPFR